MNSNCGEDNCVLDVFVWTSASKDGNLPPWESVTLCVGFHGPVAMAGVRLRF